MQEKKVRTPTIHKTDMVINKAKLKAILDSKGMEYMELWEKVKNKYGLDLTYKGFMSIISGRATWKLLYAHAIADVLYIDILDIFEVVTIDVDKKKVEKAEWKEKYQPDA